MINGHYILAIDQGTTSSRAIVFDQSYAPIASAQQEFTQHFPKSGWVEHNAEGIWQSVVNTCRGAIEKADISAMQIAGIGITNQRETVVVWDKETGKPIHNALVWQDRRTADVCERLKADGQEDMIRAKTGLLLDPYFSATKITWLLDHVDGARQKAENGDFLCGTIDCFLLWHLTNGKSHKTDATNASRTLLYNIHDGGWDDDLLALFNIPRSILPEVKDCNAEFGVSNPELLGAPISITGMAGDQHAATIGQACFEVGMIKSTYGTGCFMMLNTGDTPVLSDNRLLTTLAYQIDGRTTYALEGSIFIAGAAVQWLRDGLKIIDDASKVDGYAQNADLEQNVVLVPAFAGLGAPYWNPHVRGAMFGLTRGTGRDEICRAALEAVCFQSRDLLEAMASDTDRDISDFNLRVDGGMARSDWTMQRLSDLCGVQVQRPAGVETTALGAAWLAGYQSGVWGDMEAFARAWQVQDNFTPKVTDGTRNQAYAVWKNYIDAVLCIAQ